MTPPFIASVMATDGPNVIPFPVNSLTPERRADLWAGPLPFRPRRASDYAWLEHFADVPPTALLWRPLLLSGILHGIVLLLVCHSSFHVYASSAEPIEVDLRGPYEVVPADLARWSRPIRKGDPDSQGRAVQEKRPQAPPAAESNPLAPSKPRASTLGADMGDKTLARQGSLTGSLEGAEIALVSLTSLPKLINRQELSAGLRRYYPETERRAGHEASVVLDLHINAAGEVSHAEIVRSAGPAFDVAAIQIAKLFRFSPAHIGDKPVPVMLRQTISFRLEA